MLTTKSTIKNMDHVIIFYTLVSEIFDSIYNLTSETNDYMASIIKF